MDLSIEVRGDRELSAFARRVVREDLPYITARSINDTAVDVQKGQWAHMRSKFTIRNETFLRHGVKIKPFARKTDDPIQARVMIGSPGGDQRADIFAKFEEGGTKRATDGGRIAVPGESIRRSKGGRIRKRDRPTELIRRYDLKPQGSRVFSGKGTGVWQGKRGVFMIRKSGGQGGIFRRKGGELEVLYDFAPVVRIPASLDFIENARRTVDRTFSDNFHRAFLRTFGVR